MDLAFVILDVFTDTLHQGNPLAVVSVPASLRSKLTQETKQNIARDFGLSETVFLHEPSGRGGSGDDDDTREIDIFTTDREVPFAGHPTIGTAVLLRYFCAEISSSSSSSSEGGAGGAEIKRLVTKAGPIDICPAPSNGVRARIPHDVRLHAKTLSDVVPGPPEADRLGLSAHPAIRDAELAAPAVSIVNGMAFLLSRLPSVELLARVAVSQVDLDALRAALLDPGWRESFVGRLYYVDVEGDGEGEGEMDARYLRTRMVALGVEDPATGSAASALAAYLTLAEEGEEEEKEKETRYYHITQGVEMGRKSIIRVETTTTSITAGKGEGEGEGEGEGVKLVDIWLGGTAVVAKKGSIRV